MVEVWHTNENPPGSISPGGSRRLIGPGVRYIYDYAPGFARCTEVEHISF